MSDPDRDNKPFIEVPLPLREDHDLIDKIRSGEATIEEIREFVDSMPFTDEEKAELLSKFEDKDKED